MDYNYVKGEEEKKFWFSLQLWATHFTNEISNIFTFNLREKAWESK